MSDIKDLLAGLSPAKLKLLVAQLQGRLEESERARKEPIAVIGLACRFPGGGDTPEAFWRILQGGVDTVTEVPPERWEVEAWYDPDPHRPGKLASRWGAFVEGVDRFDPHFFGISPREAAALDPQHRLLLEVAWESLENAGLRADRLAGSRTGVFVGISGQDYLLLGTDAGRPELITDLTGTSLSFSAAVGRLSYTLGLQGPSVAVDTACSSSLVTVHLACQSLRLGDSDLALAGGVNLVLAPQGTIYASKIGVMARDGRCKTFSAGADGYVRGEGAGLVVLKRLSQARRDGDRILAVIRGSSVNQDGRSSGLTAPNGLAQQAVIRQALERAGVTPAQVAYVEAHGSGTELGDPIEVRSLAAVLGPGRPAERPLRIGSVKTNIGHLESAAGIAGVIKTVLALEHGELPPSLHFGEPNPHIAFGEIPVQVQTRLEPWPEGYAEPVAGVSSFGFVGTNAHAVLTRGPEASSSGPSRPSQLLTLSARTETALDAQSRRLTEHLRRHPDEALADVAHTLQVGRVPMKHRRVVLCAEGEGEAEEAVAALEGERPGRVFSGAAPVEERLLTFLFPGLGDHYPQLARGLYESEKDFRAALDRCAELLEPELDLDLRQVLFPEQPAPAASDKGPDLRAMLRRGPAAGPAMGKLAQTWVAQPAVFAVEYSLAQLLASWGIEPQAMIGYSLGEYVAATLAGVFTLEDALRLVARRARLIHELPPGAMLALPLAAAEVETLLEELQADGADLEGLGLSAVNGPAMAVVSGPVPAVEAVEAATSARGVAASRLATTHAFHSQMMDAIAEPFTRLVAGVERRAPRLPFVSNVTGTWITPQEAQDPAYWARHLRQAVRFEAGLETLLGEVEPRIFLEVGPGQSLGSFVKQHPRCDGETGRHVLATLRYSYDPRPDQAFLLEAVGKLWLAGVEVDWQGFARHESRRRLALPTYPFERQRCWFEATPAETRQRQPISEGRSDDPGAWFYAPVWTPAPLRETEAPSGDPRTYLLLVGDGPEALTDDELAVLGRRGKGDAFEVASALEKDFEGLLSRLAAAGRLPDRVVHLGALSAPPDADLAVVAERGFYSVTAFLRAWTAKSRPKPLDLTLISRRAVAVGPGEAPEPAQAALLGLRHCVPQELTGEACRLVDVDALPAREVGRRRRRWLDRLAAEVHGRGADAGSEPVIALRTSGRWRPTYEPLPLAAGTGALKTGGVYLLTGGLGEVGLTVAEHLGRRHGARLVLVGRTPYPPRAEWQTWLAAHAGDPEESFRAGRLRRLLALEAEGAEVLLTSADVADRAAMSAVVAETLERFGRLDGVFHCAGVLDPDHFRLLRQLDRQTAELHFRPKALGAQVLAQVLDALLEEVPADRAPAFVLAFSSISAVLGGLGFASYAAANACLDAWAQRQSATGEIPWLSVDWDGWALSEDATERAAGRVTEFDMQQAEALEALERALALPRTGQLTGQLVNSTGSLAARRRQWIYTRAEPQAKPEEERQARPQLATAYAEPETPTQELIADLWQQLFGLDRVGRHDNFFDLGGHSLLAAQFLRRLRERLGVEVPPKDLFRAPTPQGLAEFVDTLLWAAEGAGEPEPALAGSFTEGEI